LARWSVSGCPFGLPPVLIVLVLACGGVETGAPIDAAYRLLTEEVWGGGDIVLVSPAIPTVRTPISLVLAGDTVPERSRRADTVVFRAPSSWGSYRLEVLPSLTPAADSKDRVRVYGFSDYAEGPTIVGYVLQVPEVSPVPRVLVRSPDALLLVDLRDMSAADLLSREYLESGWGDCWDYQFGPGRSYRSNFTSLCGGIWQVLPDVRYEGRGAGGLLTMEIAPGRFAVDPFHPWLFFAAKESAVDGRTVEYSLKLVVVDRRTMTVAGVMTTPAPQLLPAVELTLVVGAEAVYLVPVDFWDDGQSWERTMGRYRFDVLPVVD